MAEEKNKWEIEHLKRENKKQNEQLEKQTEEIRDLQSFRDSTVEKLITIFNTINDIKEESKWMKRTFTQLLIGGIITVVGSLIVWLIQS